LLRVNIYCKHKKKANQSHGWVDIFIENIKPKQSWRST
jgi:hypothetical protein